PGSASRTINVLPSREVVDNLARPWHSIKIPQGLCPSARTTACSGKTAACFILLNASIESWERSQKKLRERRWQLRQLSTQFKPDTLIGAPSSPAEERAPDGDRRLRKIMMESFARRLPSHFGSETQCLQH